MHSDAPQWQDGEGWRVDPQPVVVLGGDTEDRDQQFLGIGSAFRLTDGTIAVADESQSKILLFSLDGRLVRSMGGEGSGPGEFKDLHAAVRLRGDSVAGWDLNGQVSVFEPDGSAVRTRTDLRRRNYYYGWMSPVTDEALFHWERFDLVAEGVVRRPWYLIRANVEGARLDTIGVWPANAAAWGAPNAYGFPSSRGNVPVTSGAVKAGGGTPWRLAVGSGEDAFLELFDESGRRIRSMSWAPQPRPVRESTWQRLAGEDKILAGIERPVTVPAYNELAVDSTGNVWARHYPLPEDTADVWTILDPDGVWLGEVSIPLPREPHVEWWINRCEMMSIGGDYLLCKYRDELRIESIVLYRVRR